MDFIGRLLGNVGRFLGNVVTAPSRAGQAAGKAVRKEVKKQAPVVQRQVQQARRSIPAPPKIDFNKVAQFAIGNPNVNPIAKAQKQIPQTLGKAAQFVAPNISKAVANPGKIYNSKDFQKVVKGKASPQEFLKEIFKVGTPLGLDAANFVGGAGLAKAPIKKVLTQLTKEGAAYTAGSSANKLLQGENKSKVIKEIPGDLASSLAAQGLGFGVGKLLGKAGSTVTNRAVSEAPKVRVVTDPRTGKDIKVFAPKVDFNQPMPASRVAPVPQNAPRQARIPFNDNGPVKGTVSYEASKALRIGTDAMGPYSEKRVAKYMADIKAGKPIDPIVVVYKNNIPYVQDGKHRLEALQKLGIQEIPVVEKGAKLPKPIYEKIPKSWTEQKPKETRGFIKQVQTSASTSPELAQAAKGVSGLYTPKSNTALLKTARNNISSDIMNAEKIATTARTDEGVATASELIKHYQALGQYDKAVEVAQKAAKNLTEAGRQVQAASLYSRISPEGILRYTQAQIDKVGGKKLSAEVAERLTKMAREVQTMPEGMDKAYAVARLQQEISKQIPTNILKKLTTLRKAGLLTGLRTQAGNAVSNLSHIGLNKVSDLPAAAVDAVASLFTGQRTKVFTTKGLLSGGKEGVGKAATFLKTGVDELGLGASKYDITPVNFKSKTVQKYVDTVFNAMGAADKPYRYAALKNQLYDLAIAEAKNKRLSGAQAGKFIKDFVTDPPMEAAQIAAAYAEKSVFGNDTVLSNVATSIRRAAENSSPATGAAVDIIMPFTKVPSAVITRLFDYTPVGAVKEAMKQIKVGKFDQRMFAQALGEAGTGTGAIALGVALASQGQITGPLPNDQRERDLWTLEGKQPNAIRFGDKWYSFNYTSPIGQLLQMGSQISSAAREGAGAVAAISNGALGGAKAVVDQSFLQGVSGVLEAINDPTRYAQNFAKSNAGSVVPTIIADLAKATDPLQRETNSIVDAVKARIPGARQDLLAKQDAFGNPLQREGSAAQAMLDPFKATQAKSNPLVAELRRLQEANQGITPNADSRKYIQVGNKKYQLTPEELNRLNSATGQETQKYWNQVTQAQPYTTFSDESKKKTLSDIYTDINVVSKYRTLFERGDREAAQQIFDKMTKAQMAYLQNGQLDINTYLAKNQPKKAKVKIAKAKKPRKARVSRGRKIRVARVKSLKLKTPKIGKAPRTKATKVRLTSTSKPKVAATPKAKRIRISA